MLKTTIIETKTTRTQVYDNNVCNMSNNDKKMCKRQKISTKQVLIASDWIEILR